MASIKLLTHGATGRRVVSVAGTEVMVGSEKLDSVASVSLEGEPGELWTLTIKVHVDPNALFEVLPGSEGAKT